MKVVLDASAAVEVATGRPFASTFAEMLRKADIVLAPDLLLAEAGNALWKLHCFAGLPSEAVLPILHDILSLVDEWSSLQEVFRPAVALALFQSVTVYDACYLVVAGETGATLLTLDKKMQAAARDLGIPVFTS